MKCLTLMAAASILALGACNKTDTSATYTGNNVAMADEASTNATETNASAGATVDSAFITEAMQGDNGEVAIGQLAQTKGTSQKVKDFGKLLVDDHGAHKEELKTLAAASGVSITDEPTPEAKTNLDKLKGLSGAEFDKQFKSMMIEDHTKDIAKYEKQASSGDAQTAALAKKTLPTLRKHLEAANAL